MLTVHKTLVSAAAHRPQGAGRSTVTQGQLIGGDDHANSGPGGGAKLLIPKYGLDYDSTESRTCSVHFRGPKSLGQASRLVYS